MRGWRQVLKDGELVTHTVGRDVEGGGEGRLLVLEHHRPHGFRVELHDDGGGLGVLVGRDGEGICDEEVGGEVGEVRHVTRSLGRVEDREQDVLEDCVVDGGWAGL